MQLHKTTSLESSGFELGLSDEARLQCAQAKEQEEAGNFEAARQLLQGFWQRVGERPETKGLDDGARAEILLRSGTLTGWIGSAQQIPGAQEIAKDLISEATRLFESFLPHCPQWFVIVRRVSCHREALIFRSGNRTLVRIIFPLRDLEPSDAQRAQARRARRTRRSRRDGGGALPVPARRRVVEPPRALRPPQRLDQLVARLLAELVDQLLDRGQQWSFEIIPGPHPAQDLLPGGRDVGLIGMGPAQGRASGGQPLPGVCSACLAA